LLEAVKRT